MAKREAAKVQLLPVIECALAFRGCMKADAGADKGQYVFDFSYYFTLDLSSEKNRKPFLKTHNSTSTSVTCDDVRILNI